MKRNLILLFFVILITQNTSSQEYYKLEEMFLDADSWFFYEDYEEALPLFLRVLDGDSLNYNVMYKVGFCYLHIPGQKAKAIPYLENAINKTTFNYRNNIYAEKEAPVDALFYLGNAYLVNNKLDEAIDAYTGFQNKISRTKKVADKDIYDIEYLERQFDACRNALQFQYEPVSFVARNIGQPINTRFNEFNAIVSGDGKTLVFTVALQFYDAIFYAKKENEKWGYPINIMGQLGIDDKAATTGLSYDGTELYIYRDDDFDGNIYISTLKDGIWSRAKKLNESINTKYWESHASPSPDNRKLYFVSNRAGGYGDLDIFEAERLNDTTWGEPTNLGHMINSKWNENTPFITPDGKRLFFSSEGHKGMGGYDIYYSTYENGEWSEPVNVGYPINTTDDDIFFAPSENGTFAYCSQFSKKGFGGQDIYQFQLLDLPEYNNLFIDGVLTMNNEEERSKEKFEINIINTKTKDTIAVLNPDNDKQNYQFQTPLGQNHLVYESLMDEETGNQYFISKKYNIREEYSSAKIINDQIAKEDTLPEVILEKYNYVAANNENIKIKLSLQKGGKLIVNTFYKDKLINTEEFDVNKEDFIYEYKPLIGESVINFKLIDKNNNVKSEEVTVSYIPKDLVAELSIDDKLITISENGTKNVKIKLSVEKGSKLFVETYVDDQLINTEEFKVRKENFIYEFEPKGDKTKLNFKLVDKHNNVTNQEVVISHKPISNEFATIIAEINTFDNKKFRKIINSKEVISSNSVTDLLDIIYSKAAAAGLSKEQAQALIITLAMNSTESTPEFIDGLLKISAGDLKSVLEIIKTNQLDYSDNLKVVQFLESNIELYNYTNKDIIALLETYLESSSISTNKLIAELNRILDTDIAEILNNLGSSAIDIVTIEDLKKQLESKGTYSPTELKYLYSLLESMLITSKAKKEINKPVIEESVTTQESEIEKNNWMFLFISFTGILLGLIIIYFNRKKNKRNRK